MENVVHSSKIGTKNGDEDFMSRLRWALLGLDHHYSALNQLRRAETNRSAKLVSVWHSDSARLQEATQGMSVELLSDWRQAIDDPNVDIILSMSPTPLNYEIVKTALQEGKHAISVKPGAMDLAGVQELADLADKHGVVLFPCESLIRLSPVNQYIKNLVEDGKLGRILSVSQIVHSRPPMDWPGGTSDYSWWIDPQLAPGGGWMDHSIYTVDLTRWLTGSEFVKVTGYTTNITYKDLQLEDYGVGILETATGAVANLEVTWHAAPKSPGRNSIQVLGETGSVVIDNLLSKMAVSENADGKWSFIDMPQTDRPITVVEHVAHCILNDKQPIASGYDQVKNLAACLAFYESAKTERAVRL